MDELKITSKIMTKFISKGIAMVIKKKLGYNVGIQVHEIRATVNDGKAHVYLNAEGDVDINEFKKFTKSIGLED